MPVCTRYVGWALKSIIGPSGRLVCWIMLGCQVSFLMDRTRYPHDGYPKGMPTTVAPESSVESKSRLETQSKRLGYPHVGMLLKVEANGIDAAERVDAADFAFLH